ECYSYPHWHKDPNGGKDRILIFEDTDGDGHFDKRTVFHDKLANVSGIQLGFGGVWVCATPNLLFIPDRDGDDVPDGPPQVVLDFDDYGEMFITNCVIEHLFHIVPGGHYKRMYGEDINPHSYGLLEGCADHIHWAGGHWTTSRGGQGEHGDAGGGHAHSGAMV